MVGVNKYFICTNQIFGGIYHERLYKVFNENICGIL